MDAGGGDGVVPRCEALEMSICVRDESEDRAERDGGLRIVHSLRVQICHIQTKSVYGSMNEEE